jgi:hypothetical protein
MLVKMSATTMSSPVVVKKHMSANECFSDSSTLRLETGLRPSMDGDFLWNSVFIELSFLQSIGQRAESMPDPETRPNLLISSKSCGGHSLSEAIGRKSAGIEDDTVGFTEIQQLFVSCPDKHVVHKQRMIRPGTDYTDAQPYRWVPAGKTVHDVQAIARLQIVYGPLSIGLE